MMSEEEAATGGTEDVELQNEMVAIKDVCQHVAGIIDRFSVRNFEGYPDDIQRCVSDLKIKMRNFGSSGVAVNEDPKTGTIPKHPSKKRTKTQRPCKKSVECKREVPENSPSSEASDTDYSDSSSHTQSDSSGNEGSSEVSGKGPFKSKPAKTVSKKKRNKSNLDIASNELASALERLDMRTAPKPEPFDQFSGQSLSHFFNSFEEYCRSTFKGSTSLWINELGRSLNGDMCQAFSSLYIHGDSFAEVKKKLMQWHKESKDARMAANKSLFFRAKMRNTEPIRLYAARLEKLYRLAYSHHKVETSRSLREKFYNSVPRQFRKQLKTAMAINKSMTSKTMSWAKITALASQEDAHQQTNDVSVDETSDDDTYIHLAVNPTPKRSYGVLTKCDAATQNDGYGQSVTRSWHPPKQHQRDEPSSWQSMQPNRMQRDQATSCQHCGRIGHEKNRCRKFLKQCLACGSNKHFLSHCPERQSRSYQQYKEPLAETRRYFTGQPQVSFDLNHNESYSPSRPNRPDQNSSVLDQDQTPHEPGATRRMSGNARPLK